MTDLDALAESARNRGLKLVRSRVRTPTKRRFGKVGLTDATGKPVIGIDSKGPTAKPEEVEDYLRNLGANDWGASLNVKVAPRKRRSRKAAKSAKPATKPPPKPAVREATPRDAEAIVELNRLVGTQVTVATVRKGLKALARDDLTPLVATLGKRVVGICSVARMVTVHRDRAVGRISHLVVSEDQRGRGIGRMLVGAAEARLKSLGCGIVEVTSNDRLDQAHAFYRHLGFERTSIRFMKAL
jgi:ribosomal protein S18 acetylase RimI-like enzyme